MVEGESRYNGKGGLSVAEAVMRLNREISLLRVRLPVISTNVELRRDGLPMSGRRAPDDPGAAVYFRLGEKPIALACDRYTSVADNLAAIAAHIAAMRTAERHGVGTLHEMFTGFTALPPARNGRVDGASQWRMILLDPSCLSEAEANYRALIAKIHPDVGGNDRAAAELNAAIAAARKAFS